MNRVFGLCLIGMGFKLTVMRLLFCLVLPLLRTSGKDRTMRIPQPPIEFDYDLWTTEDGRCMVRVKRTGEVTEVDRTTMRLLQAEEKRLRRSKTSAPIPGTSGKAEEERAPVLSLSYVNSEGREDLKPYWLADSASMDGSVMFWMLEEESRSTVKRALADLEKAGYLKKLPRYRENGSSTSNLYSIQ